MKRFDTYHYRIQLKYSRMSAHLHEQSSWMLQSTLIYSNPKSSNHVSENHTCNGDFNSKVKREEKSQQVNSFIA